MKNGLIHHSIFSKIYLFVLKAEAERPGERDFFICWYTSQTAAMAGAGPGQAPEPKMPSRSATWTATFTCFPRLVIRELDQSQGIQISNPVKDAGVPTGGLTCCATMPALHPLTVLMYLNERER